MKVESLTSLKNDTSQMLADLSSSKEPVQITEHGQPLAYLVDVQDYELMQRRVESLEGILGGERAVAEGKLLAQTEAMTKMSKWLNYSK
ncbi:type II toxin-antitoxin system Phd/YefM family antitoxin [Marinobacterium lutimaris]|uniref:Antitoxin n=1 Tax=Marinobacterium lutimaris TaxID=568106 RepID=A0A1H5Z4U1_9GAMM|nr:type II toxin-antitoxin system Phd/YefM family antitoxin [Marinobacterium lutimaris]SEG31559.1 prevent-host-death family protein [Marinobacterium lutimaris]